MYILGLRCGWCPVFFNFIDKYHGIRIIVGLAIRGKDVVYVRQCQSYPTPTTMIQKLMQIVINKRFMDQQIMNWERKGDPFYSWP
jgi:hypothetical protein